MPAMFVHLRTHTEFSVLDGTLRIDDLVGAAANDGQAALAITDLSNLFGAVKFYKAARGAGLKPLIGADVWIQAPGKEAGAPPVRLLLLVQDHRGYLNLCELLTRAWTRNVQRDQAVIELKWLQELADGLIALSGAQAGPVGQALVQGDEARAADVALQLANCFPHRFYLELQRAGRSDDERHVAAAVALAARLGLPVVATHPAQFLTADDFEAHEARVCVSEGEVLGNARRQRKFTAQQYFKSRAEMAALFADLPSALANSVADRQALQPDAAAGQAAAAQLPDAAEVDGVQDAHRTSTSGFASHEGLE
jgi:DNA polymerase III subunit alpha